MNVVNKLERTFLLFSTLLVVIFCVIIIAVICTSNIATTKEQTFSFMTQLAERPRALEGESSDTPFPYFAVTHTQAGDVIVGNEPLQKTVEVHLSEWIATALANDYDSGEIAGADYLWVKHSLGIGTVIVFADFSPMLFSTWHFLFVSCIVASLVCLCFFFLARWLAKKATAPVETAFQAQRQFINDASHELKTPLTVILTNAELAVDSDCSNESKRYTNNILRTARRMKKLSQELLDLSRAENKQDITTSTNFSVISEELALSFEAVCFEAGHQLIYTIEPEVMVGLNEGHAEQLVSILLDNAAKYAEGDGPITFLLKKEKNTARLCVSNPSQELDPDNLNRMFSRFWKADASRTNSDSYGLGLAIAKQIVEQAQGTVFATWKDGVISVTVVLPIKKCPKAQAPGHNKV